MASSAGHPWPVTAAAPIVAIAASAAAGDGKVWNMLARAGDWMLAKGGAQTFTGDLFAALCGDFNERKAAGAWPIGAPVTANHALVMGDRSAEGGKALGYITAMEVRTGSDGMAELWGEIDWTDEGRRRVQAREYQAGSIEAVPGDAPAFIGWSLTNSPAVGGLSAVAASKGDNSMDQVEKLTAEIAAQKAQIEALTGRLTAAESERDAAKKQVADYVAAETQRGVDVLCAEGWIASDDKGREAGAVLIGAFGLDGAKARLPKPAAKVVAAEAGIKTTPRAQTAAGKDIGFKERAAMLGSALRGGEA